METVKLGDKQLEIIKYLLATKNKSISEIQVALGIYHPFLISQPVKSLKKWGLITVSSDYIMKGHKINRYCLSEAGATYAFFNFGDEYMDILLENYLKRYPTLKLVREIFEAFNSSLGDEKWLKLRQNFVYRVGKLIQVYLSIGYSTDELEDLLMGVLFAELRKMKLSGKDKKKLETNFMKLLPKAKSLYEASGRGDPLQLL
jgi:hypothetical protein